MCGIAGLFGIDQAPREARLTIEAMVARLRQRGPDDAGTFIDAATGLALGHARLSIIDLSKSGHQPMSSANGRYIISFNGEVYNHLDLRDRLEAEGKSPVWRGTSDTETVLECISAWGVEATLERADAMFAFALFDRSERALTLGRDRFGEKPLYYAGIGKGVIFASTLGALSAVPGFGRTVDPIALRQLIYGLAVKSPRSIFQSTRTLAPGHVLRLRKGDDPLVVSPVAYWQVSEAIARGLAKPFQGNANDAEKELEARLSSSIKRRTISDVPLGVFLSGGIDSTTVAALCQKQAMTPIRTFTAAFEDAGHDEADSAEAIAKALGTDHTTFLVTSDEAVGVVERLHEIYDEPFADSSQIATTLICRAARQHVTVALGGDGADELFGGYNRYHTGYSWWSSFTKIPPGPRRHLANGLRASLRLSAVAGGKSAIRRNRLHKFTRIISADTIDDFYDALVCNDDIGTELFAHQAHQDSPGDEIPETIQRLNGPLRLMAKDTIGYLPNDILVKIDRASMAHGLEARSPYLEPELFEFAWSLPDDLRVAPREGKIVLRRLLSRHVPRAAVNRPKTGFSVPIDVWLRGRLRDWAESLLAASDISGGGFLDPKGVREIWQRHLKGEPGLSETLWSVLVFVSWLDHNA